MYLSLTQNKVHKPFFINSLKLNVFSYEGFCLYLYNHPEAFVDIIYEGQCLLWIEQTLKLEAIVSTLKPLYEAKADILDLMKAYLLACPLKEEWDLIGFEHKYKQLSEAKPHKRAQMIGNSCFERGDYVQAMSWYKTANASHYDVEVANNMAVIYMYQTEYEKAEKTLLKAIKHSNVMTLRFNLVRLYCALENYDEAVKILDEARQLSDDGTIWYYYGKVYKAKGQSEEALTSFMRCYDETKAQEAYFAMVEAKIHIGLYEQAIKDMSLKSLPADRVGKLFAQIHFAKGDYADYELAMEKAIEQAENKTDLLLELCEYHLTAGRVIKAIECIALVTLKDQLKEEVRLMKAYIAHSAGNQSSFYNHVDGLLYEWKNEIRMNAGR